jgi:hypothetical protein
MNANEVKKLKDKNSKLIEDNKRLLQISESMEEALIWCSGSEDFQVGGKARIGWERGIQPLLERSKSTIKEIKKEKEYWNIQSE